MGFSHFYKFGPFAYWGSIKCNEEEGKGVEVYFQADGDFEVYNGLSFPEGGEAFCSGVDTDCYWDQADSEGGFGCVCNRAGRLLDRRGDRTGVPQQSPCPDPRAPQERYCPGLAEEERRQLRAFSARRRQEALGQGLACPVPGPCHGRPCRKCGRRLNKGDPGVSASRLGDQFWHPSCFSCHFCHQQLVDLIYFQQDGRIYCGRHHAELFRPRCASCDQLIFMEECIEAEGRRWHLEHFCCLECDEPLRGQRYVMRSGRPCCRGCFESLFAEPCQACGDPIGADTEQVTHQGLHWHARSSCLCCSLCRAPLRGQPLSCHRGRLFCSGSCGRGQDGSSGASDSSDSAIASAPSPECAPAARSSRDGGQGDGRSLRHGEALPWGGSKSRDFGDFGAGRTPLPQGGRATGANPGSGDFGDFGDGGILLPWGGRGSRSKSRLWGLSWECHPVGISDKLPRLAGWVGASPPCPETPLAVGGLWEDRLSLSLLLSPLAEAFPEQPPVHPAFRSPGDLGAAPRERSGDAAKEHPGALGPPAGHPSAPQLNPEPPKEPRALLGSPEARRAAELQAGTPRPRHGARAGHGTEEEEEEEEEDSWCPTCSSSSDSGSEEEGFFFGKPIPKPGMNPLGREPMQRGRGRTAKHCSVC
ncbi:prickle-like protein 4 [Melospiza melodia melodia]|uniref:prickle-like protein 4 n=1 Tax=Melospiza melodia melodia TaxID=1914991 RepID=UPI002FCFCE9D